MRNLSSPSSFQLHAAAELWDQIENSPQPADRFLGNYLHKYRKRFGSSDRRFLSEIIYALFRHKTLIETWARYFRRTDSDALVVLAAVKEKWMESKEFRAIAEQGLPPDFRPQSETQQFSVKYSFPEWLVEKWKARFGTNETEALLKSTQERPPFMVRVNTLKISRDLLENHFKSKNYAVIKTKKSSTGLLFEERINLFNSDEFKNGWFEIQDEGSQFVCEQIAAKAGEVIWDVCAGGGGKTLAMAARMENKGRVVATDIRSFKLEDLRKRAKRAGAMNIFPAELDRISESSIAKKGFDKIVVDAPCSGTGTLRRNPDAKWKLSPEIFQRNHRDQIAILEKSLPFLKPGGKLFYITCSLEPEENEQVAEEILSKHSELKSLPIFSGEPFLRLLPHRDGTDGFFLAIFQKKDKIENS